MRCHPIYFPQKSDDLFSYRPQSHELFTHRHHSHPLSAFQLILCPVFFVNSVANIRLSLGCHPGGPPPPVPIVTPLLLFQTSSLVIKTDNDCGKGGLKWQCSVNCDPFKFLFVATFSTSRHSFSELHSRQTLGNHHSSMLYEVVLHFQ